MILTRHVLERLAQRRIPQAMLEAALSVGRQIRDQRRGRVFVYDARVARRAAARGMPSPAVPRGRKAAAFIVQEGRVVTAYWL